MASRWGVNFQGDLIMEHLVTAFTTHGVIILYEDNGYYRILAGPLSEVSNSH